MQLGFCFFSLALAATLQSTLLARVFDGARPDLVLLVVLAWSMLRGVPEGTVCGIFGGLLLDLLSSAPFGLHTVMLASIGAITALGESNLYRGNIPLFLSTAALATVLFHGGAVLGLQAAGLQTQGLDRFVQFVVPTALVNAALLPLAFTLMQRAARALGGWRQLEL